MWVVVTAKVKAVTPEPSSHAKLVEFLIAYRNWTQYVIDEIWGLDRIPSIKELHHKFYRVLRNQGFRAHHCHKIERRAREIVKATKKNRGSKPVLRKLTARLNSYDYRMDLNSKKIKLAILNGEWIELKLKWYNYLNKYLDGSWKIGEVCISYRDNMMWVYLTFRREVKLREAENVMGVDINFDSVAYAVFDNNKKLISMNVLMFRGLRRALHFKKLAESLQKRYPKSWRFIKWVRSARVRWLKRARNILNDSCHLIAKRIVEAAKEYNAVIVLEDLRKLKDRANGNNRFSWKIHLWAYRRMQSYILYKALLEGVPVAYVDPKGTSKTSPIGGRLTFINYRWVKLSNEVITTRDVIASWNLALRYLQMRGIRGMWCPDSPLDDGVKTRPKRGKPVQVSTISEIPKNNARATTT